MSDISPKLFDVVKFKAPHVGRGSGSGTVLSLLGEPFLTSALIELANESGEVSDIVSIPLKDLEVVWSRQQNAQPAPKLDAQKLFEQGIFLMQNGLSNEAVQHFEKAFALQPKLAGTLMNLTTRLGKSGSFDTAIFVL